MFRNWRTAGIAAAVLLAVVSVACTSAHHRSTGTVIDDATITATVKAKLASDERVKAYQVDVDTHSGIVTLSGVVENQLARGAATDIARSVNGVKSVDNQLRLKATG